jgi:hypothetical protein
MVGIRFPLAEGLDDDLLRQAGELVGLLADVLALEDVVEVDLAGDLREDRRGERVPSRGAGPARPRAPPPAGGAVGQRVALLLALASSRMTSLPGAVDDDQVAVLDSTVRR